MIFRRFLRMDVDAWPRERFLALFLAILLACAWMVSEAAGDHAALRRRHFVDRAKWSAVSPIPYRASLDALRVPGEARLRPLRLVLRADSADAETRARLCRLTHAEAALRAGLDVTWVALGADVDLCVARVVGGRMVRARGAAGDTLRAQVGGARWALLDADFRALYSRRDAPEPREVRDIASLVAPAPGAVARAERTPSVRGGEGS